MTNLNGSKPGVVALVECSDGQWRTAMHSTHAASSDVHYWAFPDGLRRNLEGSAARPLAVIDPEDREQVERLVRDHYDRIHKPGAFDDLSIMSREVFVDFMRAALHEFANPTPVEPTDPRTRVTDGRDNIWRLLADGDWVCTSGPDVGEYLTWPRLTGRGPLTIEAAQS